MQLYYLNNPALRDKRWSVLEYSLSHLKTQGMLLEFGVWKGSSINLISSTFPAKKVYGFDSFEGFPDDGRNDWQQDFSTPVPRVNKNVDLIVGYFDKTLPNFLDHHREKISFIHMDCDLYSSSHIIFSELLSHSFDLEETVICFDELINYSTFPWNEMLALFRFLLKGQYDIDWLCVHQHVQNIDTCLYLLKNNRYPDSENLRQSRFRQQASAVFKKRVINFSMLNDSNINTKILEMSKLLAKMTYTLKLNSLTSIDFEKRWQLNDNSFAIKI